MSCNFPTSTSLVITFIHFRDLGFNKTICENINSHESENEVVQTRTSEINMYMSILRWERVMVVTMMTWWHDDMMTWWHDDNNHLQCCALHAGGPLHWSLVRQEWEEAGDDDTHCRKGDSASWVHPLKSECKCCFVFNHTVTLHPGYILTSLYFLLNIYFLHWKAEYLIVATVFSVFGSDSVFLIGIWLLGISLLCKFSYFFWCMKPCVWFTHRMPNMP